VGFYRFRMPASSAIVLEKKLSFVKGVDEGQKTASSGHNSPTVRESPVAQTPHVRTLKSCAALGSFFGQGRRAYALR
jgi:hypothetical protein